MAEIGAKQRDQELLKQAQGVAKKINDEDSRASALGRIGKVMAQVGAKQQALELLKQAQQIAENTVTEHFKVDALREFAKSLAEIGAKQQAIELLKQALGENISDVMDRANSHREIAKVAAAIGDFHLARAVASKQADKVGELDILALILETWARSKDPRFSQ